MQKDLMEKEHTARAKGGTRDDEVFANIYNAIHEICYGTVQIHIQNNKIVQIDKVSKIRMR